MVKQNGYWLLKRVIFESRSIVSELSDFKNQTRSTFELQCCLNMYILYLYPHNRM